MGRLKKPSESVLEVMQGLGTKTASLAGKGDVAHLQIPARLKAPW
jgi:hypothetical protein